MNHAWTLASEIRFSARDALYGSFSGTAQLHRYEGEHRRLVFGAVITFDGLPKDAQTRLVIEASGLVANAVLKAAGLRPTAKLAGHAVLGIDLGGPIGDVGDIKKQKQNGVWTLAFFRR